jgi:hypothetical protein
MAAAPTTSATDDRTHPGLAEITLLLVALGQLLPGIIAVLAPGAFYDLLAGYPPENHHFIRDVGSWQIALGLLALVALRRREWRVPALGILAVQFILHTVSHIIDVSNADPSWQGPFALITEAIGAVVLTALFLREARR